MIPDIHKPDYLMEKIFTHPEQVNLKKWFNNFSVENRKKFKLKGLQMLFDNTIYSQKLYQLFISKIQSVLPKEIELLIGDFICHREHTNKMMRLPKRKETLNLLQKIPYVFS